MLARRTGTPISQPFFFSTQSSANFIGGSEYLANAMRDHGRASPKPPPNLPELQSAGRFDMVCAPQPGVGFGGNLSPHGTGCFLSGPRPAYQHNQLAKPAQTQVEGARQARARFYQRRQNQKNDRIFPVPVLEPVWDNRSDMGSILRDSKGTGFFLPRVPQVKSKTSIQSTLNEVTKYEVVEKQGKAFEEDEDQSEIHLPQEWSYRILSCGKNKAYRNKERRKR